MEVSGLVHASAAFHPEKAFFVPLEQEAEWVPVADWEP